MTRIDLFSKNAWREPINKGDLIQVIIKGLVFSIVGGILAGGIDYAFTLVNVGVSLSLVVLSILVGMTIKRSFDNYHVLYSLLGLIFLSIGLFVSSLTFWVFYVEFDFSILQNGFIYYYAFIEPVYSIIRFFKTFNFLDLLYGILNIIIYVWAYVYTYIIIKGRN